MARPGITYIDISKAAKTIQEQGKNPTVDRVLAYLGTGSKSTIAPLLKQWKGSSGKGPSTTTGLPDELIDALKNIYGQVINQAEDKITLINDETQKAIDQIKGKLVDTEDAARTLSKTNEVLEKRLDETICDKERLTTLLNEATKKDVQKEAELSGAKQQLIDRKETIEEQRAEVRRIRSHLEQYQTEIVEERQRERQQLQAQITNMEASLSQASHEKDSILAKVVLLEASLNQSQERLNALQTQHQATTMTLKLLEKDKQILETKTCEADSNLKILEQTIMETNKRLENTDKQFALVQFERDNLETDCRKKDDKIATLTDQYEILRQEKSVLEGQFKQIQSSLNSPSSGHQIL